jgi:hypothetical protein
MGFRFRKSIRLAPGIRLNLGKRGMSVSMGGRGFTSNVSARGTRTTIGLPGTGLSYSTFSPAARKRVSGPGALRAGAPLSPYANGTAPARAPSANKWVVGLVVIFAAFVLLPLGIVLMGLAIGGAAAWVYARHQRGPVPGQSALARQWALVKHNPHDPTYATLLARWYAPGISEPERRANGVP